MKKLLVGWRSAAPGSPPPTPGRLRPLSPFSSYFQICTNCAGVATLGYGIYAFMEECKPTFKSIRQVADEIKHANLKAIVEEVAEDVRKMDLPTLAEEVKKAHIPEEIKQANFPATLKALRDAISKGFGFYLFGFRKGGAFLMKEEEKKAKEEKKDQKEKKAEEQKKDAKLATLATVKSVQHDVDEEGH